METEVGEIVYIIPGKTNPSFDDCLAVVDTIHEGYISAYVSTPGGFGPERFYIKLDRTMYVVVGRM